MKNIKFVCFTESNEKLRVTSIDFFTETLTAMDDNFKRVPFNFEDVTIVQNSGLYDTSNEDIYAGDILLHHTGAHIIKTRTRAFYACVGIEIRNDDDLLNSVVIGNVFQHPQLLTEEDACTAEEWIEVIKSEI